MAAVLRIVISYRRADFRAMAGRIHDALAAHFGKSAVYMDVEDIPAGHDFRSHIARAIGDATIALVVVGPHWLGRRRGGGPRIIEEDDPIRTEVEAILQRGIPMIPVLVDDTEIPRPADLPESIRELAYRQALRVDGGEDFRMHMNRLIHHIDATLGMRPAAAANAGLISLPAAKRHLWPWVVGFAGGTVLALAGVGAVWKFHGGAAASGELSVWEVDGSFVNRVAVGSSRRLVFIRPSAQQREGGALPGSIFFEGKLVTNPQAETKQGYSGRVVLYLGACGAQSFAAAGPERAGPEIVLNGEAPKVDPASCKTIGTEPVSLVIRHQGKTVPPE